MSLKNELKDLKKELQTFSLNNQTDQGLQAWEAFYTAHILPQLDEAVSAATGKQFESWQALKKDIANKTQELQHISIDALVEKLIQTNPQGNTEWENWRQNYLQQVQEIQTQLRTLLQQTKIEDIVQALSKVDPQNNEQWKTYLEEYTRQCTQQQRQAQTALSKLKQELTHYTEQVEEIKKKITAQKFLSYVTELPPDQNNPAWQSLQQQWEDALKPIKERTEREQKRVDELAKQKNIKDIAEALSKVNPKDNLQWADYLAYYRQEAQKQCAEIDAQIAAKKLQLENPWQDVERQLVQQSTELENEKNRLHLQRQELIRQKDELRQEQEKLAEMKAEIDALQRTKDRAQRFRDQYHELAAKYEALRSKQPEGEAYQMLQDKIYALNTQLEEAQRQANKLTAIENRLGDSFSVQTTADKVLEIFRKTDLLQAQLNQKEEALDNQNRDLLHLKEDVQSARKELEKERELRARDKAETDRLNNKLQGQELCLKATYALNEQFKQELDMNARALEQHSADPCKALSELDGQNVYTFFEQRSESTRGKALAAIAACPTIQNLHELVTYVHDYACLGQSLSGTGKPIYYKTEDIRAFVAGLAVSRLLILQGLSGTGKSSLPLIFADALGGINERIAVESSWNDRNELLGYYNDFYKKFNAKPFTQALYRSNLPDWRHFPTLITLDEMNLARVEYYFADFLSVLEKNDPREWLVKLIADNLLVLPENLRDKIDDLSAETKRIALQLEQYRSSNAYFAKEKPSDADMEKLFKECEEKHFLLGPKYLENRNSIRIPTNVWFIGTVNRDESTMEITDKVYDRAQVLEFNEPISPQRPLTPEGMFVQKHLSAAGLNAMLQNASARKTEVSSKAAADLGNLNNCLMKYFDTAFGNRILEHSQKFTEVYCAAGGEYESALDYQISTKILRKLNANTDIDAWKKLKKAINENCPKSHAKVDKKIKELGGEADAAAQ